MKTKSILLAGGVLTATLTHCLGQSNATHEVQGITIRSNRTVSLTLTGSVSSAFQSYFDIYVLETSTNLVEWTRLPVLLRANASTNLLVHDDAEAVDRPAKFYRVLRNNLITPFPKLGGPYAVGTLSRLLTDPARTNRYNIPTNSSFMATFWYPAEARAGVLPGAYVENLLTQVGDYWNNPSIVAQFVSHAVPGLPLANDRTNYPVLIYSHGFTGQRRENTALSEELASRGYVVVAVDHLDAFASVFPGGQVVLGTASLNLDQPYLQPFFDQRIQDVLFLLDELSRLNTDDALLAGRLDLGKLGAFGFGLGGVTEGEVCRRDARCQAAVLLDAGYLEAWPDLHQVGLQKPFLSNNSTTNPPAWPGYSNWLSYSQSLFARGTNAAYWCQIQNSTHASFSDRGSLINDPTLTGDPTPDSRDQSLAIRALALSFFDRHLKYQDDHLLDQPIAVHCNITGFRPVLPLNLDDLTLCDGSDSAGCKRFAIAVSYYNPADNETFIRGSRALSAARELGEMICPSVIEWYRTEAERRFGE